MSGGMSEFSKALEHIRRCLFWDFAGDRLLNELQTPLDRDYFDRLMEGLTEAHDADVAKYNAENVKLRELVKSMYYDLTHMTFPPDWVTDYEADMRELGVEVNDG